MSRLLTRAVLLAGGVAGSDEEVLMLLWLVLLFVVLPVVELALLLRMAEVIHWGPTLGLVILTGVVGAGLARRQWLRTWVRVQNDLAAGRVPASEIVDGVLIFVAGLVLITPGIITDVCGFALLIPPIRGFLKRKAAAYFRSRVTVMHRGMNVRANAEDQFVDVEVRTNRPGGKLP